MVKVVISFAVGVFSSKLVSNLVLGEKMPQALSANVEPGQDTNCLRKKYQVSKKESKQQTIDSDTEPAAKRTLSVLSEKQIGKAKMLRLLQQADDERFSGNYDRAHKIFSELLIIHPESQKVLEQFSHFLVSEGFWDESLPLLERCLKVHPNSDLCNSNAVNYSLQFDGKSEQKSRINTCLENNPRNISCLNAQGVYYLGIQKYEDALNSFKLMARLNGTETVTFDKKFIEWGLGLSYKGLGEIESAVDHFYFACKSNLKPACDQLELLQDT